MDDDKFVSRDVFRAVLTIQLGQLNQLLLQFNALVAVLVRASLISPQALANALDAVGATEQGRKTAEAIAKLRGNATIEEILKDFEGPPQ